MLGWEPSKRRRSGVPFACQTGAGWGTRGHRPSNVRLHLIEPHSALLRVRPIRACLEIGALQKPQTTKMGYCVLIKEARNDWAPKGVGRLWQICARVVTLVAVKPLLSERTPYV